MAANSLQANWTDFIARYHGDDEFAKCVDRDPTAELRKAGLPVPEGKKINLIKNTDTTLHLVMPSEPDLSTEELSGICGGTFCGIPGGGCEGDNSGYTGNE